MTSIPSSRQGRGFTLIELLVVIAIIGVLSSVVLASLNTARAKARDAQRRINMIQLRDALQMYYITNGSYPLAYPGNWGGVTTAQCGPGNGTVSGVTAYISGLTPKYISVLPADPTPAACGGYLYWTDGTNYKLLNNGTAETYFPTAGQAFYDPLRPGTTWMVCSGEPACSSW